MTICFFDTLHIGSFYITMFFSEFQDKLEVVRMYQQQENQKFLAHFKKRCIIKRGRRNLGLLPGAQPYPALFLTRANGSSISTRTIQVDLKLENLNSEFCCILRFPLRYIIGLLNFNYYDPY